MRLAEHVAYIEAMGNTLFLFEKFKGRYHLE